MSDDPKNIPIETGKDILPVALQQHADANLRKIDHIVILMMENRPFDQMLGYLKLEGGRQDIDGLDASLTNTLPAIPQPNQPVRTFPVHRFGNTLFADNPSHSSYHVQLQLTGDGEPDDSMHGRPITMGGFVQDFSTIRPDDPGAIMGYHPAAHVPTYDFLAQNFCVCDRWFASVPGPTLVNRMFAIAGTSAGLHSDVDINPATILSRQFPYNVRPVIMEKLDAAQHSWRWYFSDAPTLPALSVDYAGAHLDHLHDIDDFFRDIAQGALPHVSWIEPVYVDVEDLLGQKLAHSNDDHPPADIAHGQRFVAQVLNALVEAPNNLFQRTLFIVVYDEHGGFYDHVHPPAAAPEPANDLFFARYGVRVPAFIVSPWVPAGSVSHDVFDHTSIIKTILKRFCVDPQGNVPSMGARVDYAHHLGGLLTEDSPRAVRPIPIGVASGGDFGHGVASSPTAQAAGGTQQPNDLQRALLVLREQLPYMKQLMANKQKLIFI